MGVPAEDGRTTGGRTGNYFGHLNCFGTFDIKLCLVCDINFFTNIFKDFNIIKLTYLVNSRP